MHIRFLSGYSLLFLRIQLAGLLGAQFNTLMVVISVTNTISSCLEKTYVGRKAGKHLDCDYQLSTVNLLFLA